MRKISVAALAAAAALAGGTVANAATDIDTTGALAGAVFSFAGSYTYGQTFAGQDAYLDSFSLYLDDGIGSRTMRGYLGEWDTGNFKVSNLLYSSGDVLASASTDPVEYQFAPGHILLSASKMYVAFLSVDGLPEGGGGGFGMPNNNDVIAGQFVYTNSAFTDFGWSPHIGLKDVWFKADFSDVGAIPEPATWALMIAGFGLAGAALRRRSVFA